MSDLLTDLGDTLRDAWNRLSGEDDAPGDANRTPSTPVQPDAASTRDGDAARRATVDQLGAVHPAPHAATAVAVDITERDDGWHVRSDHDLIPHSMHPHLEDAELYVRQQAGELGRAFVLRRHPMNEDGVPADRIDMAHGTDVPTGPHLSEDDDAYEPETAPEGTPSPVQLG